MNNSYLSDYNYYVNTLKFQYIKKCIIEYSENLKFLLKNYEDVINYFDFINEKVFTQHLDNIFNSFNADWEFEDHMNRNNKFLLETKECLIRLDKLKKNIEFFTEAKLTSNSLISIINRFYENCKNELCFDINDIQKKLVESETLKHKIKDHNNKNKMIKNVYHNNKALIKRFQAIQRQFINYYKFERVNEKELRIFLTSFEINLKFLIQLDLALDQLIKSNDKNKFLNIIDYCEKEMTVDEIIEYFEEIKAIIERDKPKIIETARRYKPFKRSF